MKKSLTPRQRVMNVLRGEPVDMVPFTVYEHFVKPCTQERILREQGMCVVWRTTSYRKYYKDVEIKSVHYQEPGTGRQMVRTEYQTARGVLTELRAEMTDTWWIVEYPFKSPDDYPALRALFESVRVEPAYEAAAAAERDLGEDYFVRDAIPREPLQGLISGGFLNPQEFALQWYDNRDELLALFDLSVKINEQCYDLIANGPLETANYGGNVTPQIIGPEVFRQYYMPHYEAAADILHRAGKLIGCHYDADNTPIMDDIAKTKLDYIEAYDPSCSPGLEEAFACFGDKALWIN